MEESNLSPDHKIPLCACSERQTRYLYMCLYYYPDVYSGSHKRHKTDSFFLYQELFLPLAFPLVPLSLYSCPKLVSQLRIYSFYIPIVPVFSLIYIYILDESAPTRIPLFFPVTLLFLFSCPAPLQFLQPLLPFLS